MDDAVVPAEHAPLDIDDVSGLGGAGPQALDHLGIASRGNEADVLAVLLVGDREIETTGQIAGLGLAALTQRKPQRSELLGRGRKQEIALIALAVAGAIEPAAAARQLARGDVMAGRQHFGAELA